ncbi:hypothetical protein [Deinococcus kurensis]|uniref:hypothetical protein n=1 Tax=Deinococcus kurensis TaxID=2662757 RepID=UPI0012D316DF|nr:hypothetical protein [Deinococcus kurensis]
MSSLVKPLGAPLYAAPTPETLLAYLRHHFRGLAPGNADDLAQTAYWTAGAAHTGLYLHERCNPDGSVFMQGATVRMIQTGVRVPEELERFGPTGAQLLLARGQDYPLHRSHLRFLRMELSRNQGTLHDRLTYYTTSGQLTTTVSGLSQTEKKALYGSIHSAH